MRDRAHATAIELIGERDVVVVTLETRGRVVGNFHGIPGDGKPFHNQGVAVCRLTDGKISPVEPYFNDLPIALEQLGGKLVPVTQT